MRYLSRYRLLLVFPLATTVSTKADNLRHKTELSHNYGDEAPLVPRMRRRNQEIEGLDDKYAFGQDNEYQEIEEALRNHVKSISFNFEWPEDPLPEAEKNSLALSPLPEDTADSSPPEKATVGTTVINIIDEEPLPNNPFDDNQSPPESVSDASPPQTGSTSFTIIADDPIPWDANNNPLLRPENGTTSGSTIINIIDTVPTAAPSQASSELVLGSIAYVGNDHDGWFYDRYPMGVCKGKSRSNGTETGKVIHFARIHQQFYHLLVLPSPYQGTVIVMPIVNPACTVTIEELGKQFLIAREEKTTQKVPTSAPGIPMASFLHQNRLKNNPLVLFGSNCIGNRGIDGKMKQWNDAGAWFLIMMAIPGEGKSQSFVHLSEPSLP
jgi:hypothetical protein